MSTQDEKAPAISDDAAGQAAGEPKDSALGSIILFFILGLGASWVLGWVIFPQLLYSQKRQPVNFNHVLHTEEVDDGCASCHYFREDGSFSGIPKTESCADCHEDVIGETEDERILVEEYINKGREIPWLVYSRQPDCVFFSHAAHVEAGHMDCVTCHGHIGETTVSRVYEENRISGYSRDIWGKSMLGLKQDPWDRMKMDDCADCHAEKQVGVRRTNVKNPVSSHFLETVNMLFPLTINEYKGTSVQTEKDGCLVCHW